MPDTLRVLLLSGRKNDDIAGRTLPLFKQQNDEEASRSPAGAKENALSGANERFPDVGNDQYPTPEILRGSGANERSPDVGNDCPPDGKERGPSGGRHAWEPLLLRCEAGRSLSETVFLSGLIPSPALCAGHALCGRCRVRILAASGAELPAPLPAELRRLSTEELAQGFRLACRHRAEAGMLLEIPVPSPHHARHREAPSRHNAGALPGLHAEAPRGPLPPFPIAGHGARGACSLALDLGTTTLHWRLLAPAGEKTPPPVPGRPDGCSLAPVTEQTLPPAPGREREGAAKRVILWEDARANPQAGAGSDVISRLAFAQKPGGGDTLRALILNALRDIVRESLRRAAAAGYGGVERICAAGNPVMTALLLGRKISGTAHAPEFPAVPDEENIPGLPPLVTPPQLSSFVGGDITAGYAALALDPDGEAPDFPFLLADMGTNGEFLLALSPDAALTSSVALGPALEGAGLYSGVEACPGAAADFLLEADGLKALMLPEDFNRSDAVPRKAGRDERLPGMTGAACLSLLHILLRCGVMNKEGFFTAENAGPMGRFFPLQRDAGGESFVAPGYGLRLYASDVESVLKVKAAFSLGIERLLAAAGLAFSDLAVLYSAGSLGRHVRKDALEGLGFIPPGSGERLRAPGNTSLTGAELLLRRPEILEELSQRAKRMRTVDLAADPDFACAFAASMHF